MKTKIKKDWYGRLKSAEELHNDSKLWISEIDFIKDEIRFLNNLLSSNYIQLLSANYIQLLDGGFNKKTTALVKGISDQKITANTLYKLIRDHNNKLSILIESKSVTSNIHYFDTHKKLSIEIDNFLKKYRKTKKQIFQILDNTMTKKGVKKLI